MPYEISFNKRFELADRDQYINECCIGGDIVLNHLLPSLQAKFGDVQADQEDWGWFVWFEHEGNRLAVDVFTDDPEAGEFRIHLTSRLPRLFLSAKVVDTPQLESLKQVVESGLKSWSVAELKVSRLDAKYNAI